MEKKYIASLDVGTTTLRCYIYDLHMNVVGKAVGQIKLLYPKPHFVEISPNELWDSTVQIIKDAIHDAKLSTSDIRCLGISTLRATFVTWRKSDGKELHNFITWKDTRACDLVKEWNSSILLKGSKVASYCLHLLTGQKKFQTFSGFKFANNLCSVRLQWVISNVPGVKEALANDDLLFGTVDTWLIHKFTSKKLYVTDITNASATGIFDPYVNQWSGVVQFLTNLPLNILPQVVANDFDFGKTEERIFGVSIPIKCVMADQSASLYGSGCFDPMDLKLTLGTGGFLNINTGSVVEAGNQGTYPMVAWNLKERIVYDVEVSCNDAGSLIEWAINAGLIENVDNTSSEAFNARDNDGVYFISHFTGLSAMLNGDKAACGFLGIKPTTRKKHMVRAIVESIVFRAVLCCEVLKRQFILKNSKIRIDGGVSKNDFICQLLADMTGLEVERPESTEMTGLGIAAACAYITGAWDNQRDIIAKRRIDRVFHPTTDNETAARQKDELENWLKAAERFKSWYD